MLHAIPDDGNKKPGEAVPVDGVEEQEKDAERGERRHKRPSQKEESAADEGQTGGVCKTGHAAMLSLVVPGDVEAHVAVPKAGDCGEKGKDHAEDRSPPVDVKESEGIDFEEMAQDNRRRDDEADDGEEDEYDGVYR